MSETEPQLTAQEHAGRASAILVAAERAVAYWRDESGPGGPGRQERAERILANSTALAQAHALTAIALIKADTR